MAIWDFLSEGASKLVDSIGSIIDNVSTTDEEKLELKNALSEKINEFKLQVMQKENDYEKELTERLKSDMTSDSWLSKSARPFILIFLTVMTLILAYLTVFILPNETNEMLKEWIDLLKLLLLTVYGFYFGSRGIEKIQKMKYDSPQRKSPTF